MQMQRRTGCSWALSCNRLPFEQSLQSSMYRYESVRVTDVESLNSSNQQQGSVESAITNPAVISWIEGRV